MKKSASPAGRADPRASASASVPWLWILALVALVFIAFKPALDAEFLSWDDESNITWNHEFRGLDGDHLRWMFTTDHMGPYQPLAWLSLAVDHALWGLGGPDSFPEAPRYHFTSVAIHALAAVAFFLLARRLLAKIFARPPDELGFASFVAAAFFAIHPLRVESVAWITERRDVLCGLFYVLAAWAWLGFAESRAELQSAPGRLGLIVLSSLSSIGALGLISYAVDLSEPRMLALRAGGGWMLAAGAAFLLAGAFAAATGSRRAFGAYALVIVLFLCALLSKGVALVLPGVLLVLDVWPLRRARDVRTFAAAAVEKVPLFVLAIVFARIAFWGQRSIPGMMASWNEHTLAERVLQAFFGLAFYVHKTLLPVRLSPIYNLPDALRLAEPRYFLSIAAVAAATAALFLCRRRAPAFLVAWIAYAIVVAPVLGFSQAGPQIAADRYSYFACLPFALLAGAAAIRWRRQVVSIAMLAILAVLAGLTFAQARVWKDSTTLWEHAVALDKDGFMNNLNLGHARVRQSERMINEAAREELLDEAQHLFEHGLLAREHPLLYAGLASVHQHRWEHDPKHPPAEAAQCLDFARRALDLATKRGLVEPEYHLNLGSALGNTQHLNEALTEFQSFVREQPNSYLGHLQLGRALHEADRFAESAREFERAAAIEPGAVEAWGKLGVTYERLGEKDKAISAYQRVLALAPGQPTAQHRLTVLQSRMTVDVVPK